MNRYFIPTKDIRGERPKCYEIYNGWDISYLAKSQMLDIKMDDKGMTFVSPRWFGKIHSWLKIVEKNVQVQNLQTL